MTLATLQTLFRKDLEKLRNEISLYKLETNIWRIDQQISNSAGNLCLHLVGNLNTYIGSVLAKSGYTRNRELEFSLKDIPRAILLQQIDDTIAVVEKGLSQLTAADLEKDFPVIIWEETKTTVYTLIYLLSHLGYHLGQINYHRRLMDK